MGLAPAGWRWNSCAAARVDAMGLPAHDSRAR
jgi:hypothetical protein